MSEYPKALHRVTDGKRQVVTAVDKDSEKEARSNGFADYAEAIAPKAALKPVEKVEAAEPETAKAKEPVKKPQRKRKKRG